MLFSPVQLIVALVWLLETIERERERERDSRKKKKAFLKGHPNKTNSFRLQQKTFRKTVLAQNHSIHYQIVLPSYQVIPEHLSKPEYTAAIGGRGNEQCDQIGRFMGL